MRIPYVIDNEEHRLGDVLNAVLAEHAGRVFHGRGYAIVRERLGGSGVSGCSLAPDTFTGTSVILRIRPAMSLRT